MSRSYKKTPWSGDHKGKGKKRAANQSVRVWLKDHPDILLNGGSYKKIYETWDICDYGWIQTWKEYWESAVRFWEWEITNLNKDEPFPDKKEVYRRWVKYYKMK